MRLRVINTLLKETNLIYKFIFDTLNSFIFESTTCQLIKEDYFKIIEKNNLD